MIALDGRFYRADVEGSVTEVPARRAHPIRGGRPLRSGSRRSISRARSTTTGSWPRSTAGSPPRRPPAPSGSTVASSSSGLARCRARSRPTGRSPRSSRTSTSSSSPTSTARCSASASPRTPRGSRSPAGTSTSSARTGRRGGHVLDSRSATARVRLDPSGELHVELPPGIDLADRDAAGSTHAAIDRVEHSG